MDDIVGKPEKANMYIKKALNNLDKVVYLPASLYEFYQKKISGLQAQNDIKESLNLILECAKKGKCIYGEYLELCKIIYGSLFEKMQEIVIRDGRHEVVPRGEYVGNEIKNIFEEMYSINIKNPVLVDFFGKSVLKDFDVSVIQGTSFAEWWDSELLSRDKDLLILYENTDSKYYYDLKYTIYHETYPGHGQFYQALSDRTTFEFDHGAISVIEGWATYAEWHSEDSEYIRNVRKNALYYLAVLNTYSIEQVDQILIKNKLNQGYSMELALQSVVNATQIIGFTECYYYGALWLETFLEEKNILPKDFLEFLSKHNVIEGFAIWNTIY